MTSNAPDVDAYLTEVPTERSEALSRIRVLCREILSGYDESMEYGMPSYARNGVVEVAFASQKQNIALYILKTPVLDRYRDRFAKSAVGKGCIRYTNPNKIDFTLVETLLRESVESDAEVC